MKSLISLLHRHLCVGLRVDRKVTVSLLDRWRLDSLVAHIGQIDLHFQVHSWRSANLLLSGQCKFVVSQQLLKHAGSEIVLRRRLLIFILGLSIDNVNVDELGFSHFGCASQNVALCIAASLRCLLIGELCGLGSRINPGTSRVS